NSSAKPRRNRAISNALAVSPAFAGSTGAGLGFAAAAASNFSANCGPAILGCGGGQKEKSSPSTPRSSPALSPTAPPSSPPPEPFLHSSAPTQGCPPRPTAGTPQSGPHRPEHMPPTPL